jgi:hypothetical protein
MSSWKAPKDHHPPLGPRHHQHPPPPPSAFGPGGRGPHDYQPPHFATWEALEQISGQLARLTQLIEQGSSSSSTDGHDQ